MIYGIFKNEHASIVFIDNVVLFKDLRKGVNLVHPTFVKPFTRTLLDLHIQIN